jgi:hypothetical protein
MSAPVHERIRAIVEREERRLAAMAEPAVSRKPAAGKWCPKEVLGHLVDSGGNNLQRFVRAQLADSLDFPAYEQERWVAVQDYAGADWALLLRLWASLNAHIAHVVSSIPAARLTAPCRIGGAAPLPLEKVVQGYVDHLEHHLRQI